MLYGDGGAGKTTLTIDLACHLAAGDDWLGIPIPNAVNVLLIEREGPRPLLRRKARRKLDGWTGSELEGRVRVWEAPWATFTFADAGARRELADLIRSEAIDVVIVGPLNRVGMDEAGTLQEVRDFTELVRDTRQLAGRPVAVLLIHHENKGGKVSGAWEGAGDTLIHVQAQGHGHTRLHIQKARWASSYHGQTLHLRWADGEGFELEDEGPARPERVWNDIAEYVRAHGGCSWNEVDGAISGTREYLAQRRNWMLADGLLVNAGTGHSFKLWHKNNPARPLAVRDAEPPAEPPDSPPGGGDKSGSPERWFGGSALRDEPPPANHFTPPAEIDGEHFEHVVTEPRPTDETCRRCGEDFRRGTGNRGDLCRECVNKEFRADEDAPF